jgi:hypothetical protein
MSDADGGALQTSRSVDVRARLVDALELDLIGPPGGHALGDERIPARIRPSTWYLTGFLVPSGTPPAQRADADEQEDLDEVPGTAGPSEESTEDRKSAKKGFFPSSIGLSFLVGKTRKLVVDVIWGDYAQPAVEIDDETGAAAGQSPEDRWWQRRQRHETVPVVISLEAEEPLVFDVPNSNGLQLQVVTRQLDTSELDGKIPAGTLSVSIFLINHRELIEEAPDAAYAFQAELRIGSDVPFVPRPDLRDAQDGGWDERVADLHYADTPEYATGHGVSADWQIVDGECHEIRTTWIPRAQVEKTETVPIDGVELSMEVLGALEGGAALETALRPLVSEYRSWIRVRRAAAESLSPYHRETAQLLLANAEIAAERIEKGISVLVADEQACEAFRVANRAVARALRQRMPDRFVDRPPSWRAFQLAFILLNLPGAADPHDAHRNTVDLLFFPTGGGKTEAYLGLAAFAMVLRRLRHPGDGGRAGAGVSVIMRYTLRLLTLDQLSRAAGLVCALELERDDAEGDRYGTWPFEIGLWVGKAATPNILGKKGDKRNDTARTLVRQFKSEPNRKPSPIPLENCPWCQTKFGSGSFSLMPNDDFPVHLEVRCVNFECDFAGERALPLVAVDEPLYRRLPSFLIATVDKFASLPWVGPSGALLGGADRFDEQGFYGAAEPRQGKRLAAPLPPPDLIIQDELHLISGPLGTMAGLYESAIEALCVRSIDGVPVRPKIVASTATARQAQDQVQALFGRPTTQIFPPPGPDRRDSFFARTRPAAEVPARLYLGIASPGRNPKVRMRKAWVALMGAAQQAYDEAGGDANLNNPADPYMTVLGYFNSLRELGGGRRILEEEVQSTVKGYGSRKRLGEAKGLFHDRASFSEVVELTSRVSTDKVAEARRRLACAIPDEDSIDCAIATNMISVGLDIQRLGLMVVLGQPKTHSEYIQATSRVGRDDAKPGLVVTLLNIHKPRDRSHYERFRHYHETFYRGVEAASVTPFSARALDRGFAGALVTLARHSLSEMTPAEGAAAIAKKRVELEALLKDVFLERVRQQPIDDDAERAELERRVQDRIGDLLDSWQKVVDDYQQNGADVQYQPYELKKPKALLREMLETEFDTASQQKYRVNRSLRDVEPEVNLFLRDLSGQEVEVAE